MRDVAVQGIGRRAPVEVPMRRDTEATTKTGRLGLRKSPWVFELALCRAISDDALVDEVLPFRPGTSPFHIKGTGYRGHMKYAEANVPGGVRAMLAGLSDPSVHAWFEQPFLASSWYDILPLLPAGRVCARLMGLPYEQYLASRTRAQAQEDLRGVYSVLLKVVSTESVATRLPRIVSQYFDFSRVESHVVSKGIVGCSTTALPKVLLPWYKPVVLTFVKTALEISGARQVDIQVDPTEPDGAVAGAATVRFRWSIHWDTG